MKKGRFIIPIILCILIPLGFYTKAYTGWGEEYVHDHLGGIIYEVFFILLVLWVVPGLSPLVTAVIVFSFTSGLEFLQLWKPPFLEAVRNTILGEALIGSSFSWADFPWYITGCVAGWLAGRKLRQRHDREER